MNHKLKALGLALCAIFALGAVSASAASAVEHHIKSDTKTGTTTVTAKAEGPQVFYTTTADSEVETECESLAALGEFEGSETTEITVEPSYSECGQREGETEFVAKLTANGCHYTFKGETTEDVTENQSAPVDLTCPGKGITVEVTIFNFGCIEVKPNQELKGVVYKNDAENENALTIEAKVHGIHSTTEGVCSKPEQRPDTHTDGLYEGNITVTGYESESHKSETEVDLDLRTTGDLNAVHHILSDTGTGTTSLTAKAEGPQVFYATTAASEVGFECEGINVNGEFLGEETTEITVEPSYSECGQREGETEYVAKLTTNGCHYTFKGETTEDVTEKQSAPLNLTCPSKGITIDITVFNFACIEVKPNQELEGAIYKNDAENENALTIEAKIHGIHSTTEGVCSKESRPDTHNDGLYVGNITVTGYEDEAHSEEVDLDLLSTFP